MLYPVYVHLGDEAHAHGVTIPDFPGCFSAADDWQDLPLKIQEAMACYLEGEEMDLPMPTPLTELANHPDYQGGIWLLVELDGRHQPNKQIPIQITLPEQLVVRMDQYVAAHNLTRSAFIAQAANQVINTPCN